MAKQDETPSYTVKAIFTPSETDHLLRALDLAIKSGQRARNTKSQPEFNAIYDKILGELNALVIKIKGSVN